MRRGIQYRKGFDLAFFGRYGDLLAFTMNDIVCNYAVVRFLPYRETGEFANVGVVVYAPQTGFFEYRCEKTLHGRTSAFFPRFDAEIYRSGLRNIEDELGRVQKILGERGPVEKAELPGALARFRELVRPREGLFHFDGQGTLLAGDAEEGLEQVYSQFVLCRSFTDSPSNSNAGVNGADETLGPAGGASEKTGSATGS
jgi:hypothetical protein